MYRGFESGGRGPTWLLVAAGVLCCGAVLVLFLAVSRPRSSAIAVPAPSGSAARPPSVPAAEPEAREPPARAATVPVSMVAVAGGRYSIGCDESEPRCLEDERPVHPVNVRPFAIGRVEVTSKEYDECVATGSCPDAGKGNGCNWLRTEFESHPINCVDFAGAEAYCAWKGWRLPTEVEWEAAAAGTERKTYPWGDAAPSCARTQMSGNAGRGCGTGHTAVAGSKPDDRSWSEAQDLGGNVREWVSDRYIAYSGGVAAPGVVGRVNRGGSFEMNAGQFSTVHTRTTDTDETRRPDLGFRCALSLQAAEGR